MKSKKIISIVLIVVMSAMALVACGNTGGNTGGNSGGGSGESSSTATETEPLDKLTFTYVTSPLNVPSIIEKDQGVFASTFEGTEVEYAEITSGADQTQALASGDVQVLYAVGGTSVILSAANGADIKVLNMYSRAPKAFCLFSTDESINSPEDLRGKSIAGPTGTNLHELLVQYLATADMTIDDVDYVNMSIPDAKAALDGGSIDVAMLGGAAAYNAQKAGYHKITDGDGLIKAIICVAVTKEFYDAHPEVIEGLKNAQAQITDYMKNNEEDAIAAAAAALDLDVEGVREMYTYYDFSTEISDADKDGFQKTADFMYGAGMIESEFDTSELFID